MIKILSTATINFEDLQFRHCDIIIAQNGTAYLWSVGGLPPEGDLQAILDSREAELWAAAQAGSVPVTVTERESKEGPGVARGYFASHPAAVAFVRLTPTEQEAQINTMTNAQMKTLLKYLTIAVSMLIKRELL